MEEADEALEKALRDVLRETPDVHNQEKIDRRRWFGISMLSLATFCLLVGVAPWPGKQFIDLPMWATFAAVLLIVGGWQLSKASKEAADALRLRKKSESEEADRIGKSIRRIK